MNHHSLETIPAPQITELAEPNATALDAVVAIQEIDGLPLGFFNAAAWRTSSSPDSPTYLLGRLVEERGKPGDPDVGSMMMAVVRNGKTESLTEVWRPEPVENRGDILEDARAVVGPLGSLLLGFSRLSPCGKSGYEPFPAFAITTTEALLDGDFPDTHHIVDLSRGHYDPLNPRDPNGFWLPAGKNGTPLDPDHYLFRPEDDNHGFSVFKLNQCGAAENMQRLALPDDSIPPWAEWRSGSTMPPVWLNEYEAFLPIHGISRANGLYRYSVGSARLFRHEDGSFALDNVSPEPYLTPESFRSLYPDQQVELRPEERQAVYLCGGVPEYTADQKVPERVRVYPNVGDTRTVEAALSVPVIVDTWDRSEPAHR